MSTIGSFRWTISRKLIVAFGAVTLVFVIALAVTIAMASSAQDEWKSTQKWDRAIEFAGEQANGTRGQMAAQALFVATGDPKYKAEWLAQVAAAERGGTKLGRLGVPQIKAIGDSATAADRRHDAAVNTALFPAMARRDRVAAVAALRQADRNVRIPLAAQDKIVTFAQAERAKAIESAQSKTAAATTIAIVAALLGIVLAAAIALLLARKLRESIQAMIEILKTVREKDVTELNRGIEAMRNDDLTYDVVPSAEKAQTTNQDFGDLADEVEQIRESTVGSASSFNEMREQYRRHLGDQSVIAALGANMSSLASGGVSDLNDGLGAITEGDLTHGVTAVTAPIEGREGASIGELGRTFNTMLERAQEAIGSYEQMRIQIAEMIREISQASGTVASASAEMASTSEEAGRAVGEIAQAVTEVAAGAERQVRTVESAKTLTGEVAEASQASARSAQATSEAAEKARAVAQAGADAVAQAGAAMAAMSESSGEVNTTIKQLGEKSEQIGGIVSTISGIAEQTNLLALNAAIEAARAGEQGRGFAVVAEEVRKLAEESQEAAATIGSLIKEIQSETSRAVEVVDTGQERTEAGVSTVAQARESFLAIGGSVDDVTAQVDEIAALVEQIAASSARVQENMGEVAAVAEQSSASSQQVSASTQQTSASTQQIASSAQGLAGTATQLEALVQRFNLAGAEGLGGRKQGAHKPETVAS
ncbi:MAG: methyl-accepting chemotaxis protein [Solirubrobacteraceae bacterium]